MNRCSKCSTTERLTLHHVNPVTFYSRKGNYLKICLCRECHDRLENVILSVESFIGDVPYGQRFKLKKDSYAQIARNFLGNKKVIYVGV